MQTKPAARCRTRHASIALLVWCACASVGGVALRDGVPAADGATACDGAEGRVLEVGAGKAYPAPSAAAAVAQAGDVVKIDAGDYRGDVATWRAPNLRICGTGGRARLFADGKHAQGKAIWVIAGAGAVVDSVEFHGARVPDRNGAGIRAEGGNLTVRNCGFFDGQEGILGGNGGEIVIDRSEFARNGFGDGQSHNLYIGDAQRLVVTSSFFHSARIGHNLKSRARETRIENSYFMDGASGTASYQVDFPNGGVVYMRGNVLQKGPRADNPTVIAYGQEFLKQPVNTLEMVHNTVVSTYRGGAFIAVHGSTQRVRLVANLFAGTNHPLVLTGAVPDANVSQRDNVVADAASLPGATDLARPHAWTAALRARLSLRSAPDAGYTHDAPQPLARRPLTAGSRFVGALQSSP